MKIIEKAYSWNGALITRKSTKYIVIHHMAGEGDADYVHRIHLGNGWSGIGYNFLVRKDGKVYTGRPIDKVGAHTATCNSVSVGVCFEGNYEKDTAMPEAQKQAGKELIAYLKGIYPSALVKKHKDFQATACPGRNFPFNEITSGKPTVAKPTTVKTTTTKTGGKTVNITMPVIEKGSEGNEVKTAQRLLICLGYSCGDSGADGDFGAATDGAVRAFQKAKGLTVDGVVGKNTWNGLLK